MSIQGVMPTHHGRQLPLVVKAISCAVLVVLTQGCCDVICPPDPPLEPPVTHSVAFAVDMTRCPCPDATCVCPVPEAITVWHGHKVHFVNASPYGVTVNPSVAGSFVEGNNIVVSPGQTVIVTVSDVLPDETSVLLDMTIDAPGISCPGLPGPHMDIDDD